MPICISISHAPSKGGACEQFWLNDMLAEGLTNSQSSGLPQTFTMLSYWSFMFCLLWYLAWIIVMNSPGSPPLQSFLPHPIGNFGGKRRKEVWLNYTGSIIQPIIWPQWNLNLSQRLRERKDSGAQPKEAFWAGSILRRRRLSGRTASSEECPYPCTQEEMNVLSDPFPHSQKACPRKAFAVTILGRYSGWIPCSNDKQKSIFTVWPRNQQ